MLTALLGQEVALIRVDLESTKYCTTPSNHFVYRMFTVLFVKVQRQLLETDVWMTSTKLPCYWPVFQIVHGGLFAVWCLKVCRTSCCLTSSVSFHERCVGVTLSYEHPEYESQL